METREIKEGQVWKTRDGKEVTVTRVYKGDDFPVWCDDERSRTACGSYLGLSRHAYDMVELVRDVDEPNDEAIVDGITAETMERLGEAVGVVLAAPTEVHGKPMKSVDCFHRTEHIAKIIIRGMMDSMDTSDLQLYIDLYDHNTK